MIRHIPIRTLRVAEVITSSPMTSESCAERLGISIRTVVRDIARLREIGVPLEFDYSVNAWRVGRPVETPPWFTALKKIFTCKP